MTKPNPSNGQPVKIPLGFRIGGAFMAIALVLLIFGVLSVFTDGWMAKFAVTPRFVAIVLAAAVLGAFATVNKNQEGSKAQVGALAVALLLVVGSRFIPNEAIVYWQQYWLVAYAAAAFICALVIRQALARK